MDFAGLERLRNAAGTAPAERPWPSATGFRSLTATVADLPSVVRLTERFIAASVLSHRIGVSATDLRTDSPEGIYDAAGLRAFLQTMGPEQARMAVENIGRSLVPGGTQQLLLS